MIVRLKSKEKGFTTRKPFINHVEKNGLEPSTS